MNILIAKSLFKTVIISLEYIARNGIVTSKKYALLVFKEFFQIFFQKNYANSNSCQQETRSALPHHLAKTRYYLFIILTTHACSYACLNTLIENYFFVWFICVLSSPKLIPLTAQQLVSQETRCWGKQNDYFNGQQTKKMAD